MKHLSLFTLTAFISLCFLSIAVYSQKTKKATKHNQENLINADTLSVFWGIKKGDTYYALEDFNAFSGKPDKNESSLINGTVFQINKGDSFQISGFMPNGKAIAIMMQFNDGRIAHEIIPNTIRNNCYRSTDSMFYVRKRNFISNSFAFTHIDFYYILATIAGLLILIRVVLSMSGKWINQQVKSTTKFNLNKYLLYSTALIGGITGIFIVVGDFVFIEYMSAAPHFSYPEVDSKIIKLLWFLQWIIPLFALAAFLFAFVKYKTNAALLVGFAMLISIPLMFWTAMMLSLLVIVALLMLAFFGGAASALSQRATRKVTVTETDEYGHSSSHTHYETD